MLKPPCDPKLDKECIENGWMDFRDCVINVQHEMSRTDTNGASGATFGCMLSHCLLLWTHQLEVKENLIVFDFELIGTLLNI